MSRSSTQDCHSPTLPVTVVQVGGTDPGTAIPCPLLAGGDAGGGRGGARIIDLDLSANSGAIIGDSDILMMSATA
eukprot:4044408-Pyramimonas_sp.AAC.1